ncbi:hypothetical protein [Bergeyella zoohelcum]|uniref:hypothetical protein n=1 Tax=Bergeyella zoohelcum TaxID=1015 RepID=UPI002A91B3A5|nr:hypothetical protein [Bergeyella zoohelcum]MDY6024667.1 hypothetical protein [Bergeyella zoohelcum]
MNFQLSKMLDNLKIRTYNQAIINRLNEVGGFVVCDSLSNRFTSKQHYTTEKIKLHFYKVESGYAYVDISLSPHYHFNDYRHNGNDFSVNDCIKTLTDILHLFGIKDTEFSEFKPVNLEFGVNITPHQDTRQIIDGVTYYKKTKFIHSRTKGGDLEYSKISDATSEKQIKIYAKGLQCHEVLHTPEIDANTLRYEIKSKRSRYLKKLGINNLTDLLTPKTYTRLSQELINDFNHILILNFNANLDALTPKDRGYITRANSVEFWDNLTSEKHRNSFGYNRQKYERILKAEKFKHALIFAQILDKILKINFCANSSKKTTMNKGKSNFDQNPSDVIKWENAQKTLNTKIKQAKKTVKNNDKKEVKKPHQNNAKLS